jgi:hypothetical protein
LLSLHEFFGEIKFASNNGFIEAPLPLFVRGLSVSQIFFTSVGFVACGELGYVKKGSSLILFSCAGDSVKVA